MAELLDRIDLTTLNDEETKISELKNDIAMEENEFLNNAPRLELLSRDKKWRILNNTSSKKENSATVAMEDGVTISQVERPMKRTRVAKDQRLRQRLSKIQCRRSCVVQSTLKVSLRRIL